MKKNKLLVLSMPLMAILLILVVYSYGYQGIHAEMASLKEAEASKAKTLAKYMALFAEKPEMEKQLAALKEERKAENSKLIEGQTPSIAAAALQETINGMITAHGGSVTSQRVGKPETLGKFTLITVSMDLTLPDVRALADILYAIETRTPYLVVKELDVRVTNFKEPKALGAKLDVSALTSRK
jgi:hypothetical protein